MSNKKETLGELVVNKPLTRRTFLAASAGSAAVVAAGQSVASVCIPTVGTALSTGPEPTARDFNLDVGAALGGDWTVIEVGPVKDGAMRVVVNHGPTGRLANVYVCKAEGRGEALATTGKLDLFLMNDGKNGRALTPDDEVAMAHRLAEHLKRADARLADSGHLLGRRQREAFAPSDHLDPEDPWLPGWYPRV